MTNQLEHNIEQSPAGVEWALLFGTLLADRSASKLSAKPEAETGSQVAIKANNEDIHN